ncbi:cellulase family glycosylhydrolase [Pelomyxa schiedti]|nr:cellulase family glycosylhydrolase [Pelomyxa schiedti]
MKGLVGAAVLVIMGSLGCLCSHSHNSNSPGTRWTTERAVEWAQGQEWRVGCNFIPSTAINQLEMWQEDTFDLDTIDRELGWASSLGFNSVRVFLHDLAYSQDPEGFLARVDAFLDVAESHKIETLLVLLDGCWDPWPQPSTQRDPLPWVHNSGWVQSPGLLVMEDRTQWNSVIGDYIYAVVSRFADDTRVWGWDLFNEPDNPNKPAYQAYNPTDRADASLGILNLAFSAARNATPTQPLTAGLWWGDWDNPDQLAQAMIDQSDILSFHNYDSLSGMQSRVASLTKYGRPMVCTEYMARPQGSTFDPILGWLKSQSVGAHNWGFVYGKTQTIMPWDSWCTTYTSEPPLWFHDIFRQDGTPYNTTEIAYIQSQTMSL